MKCETETIMRKSEICLPDSPVSHQEKVSMFFFQVSLSRLKKGAHPCSFCAPAPQYRRLPYVSYIRQQYCQWCYLFSSYLAARHSTNNLSRGVRTTQWATANPSHRTLPAYLLLCMCVCAFCLSVRRARKGKREEPRAFASVEWITWRRPREGLR